MPAALLAQKWEYSAAVLEPTESNILHSQGLLTLVSGIASAESFLLAKGGNDAGAMLEWLVDGLGGGGGLGLEGATIAASSWPCLAAVPRSKRRDVLQAPFFAALLRSPLTLSSSLFMDASEILFLLDSYFPASNNTLYLC